MHADPVSYSPYETNVPDTYLESEKCSYLEDRESSLLRRPLQLLFEPPQPHRKLYLRSKGVSLQLVPFQVNPCSIFALLLFRQYLGEQLFCNGPIRKTTEVQRVSKAFKEIKRSALIPIKRNLRGYETFVNGNQRELNRIENCGCFWVAVDQLASVISDRLDNKTVIKPA